IRVAAAKYRRDVQRAPALSRCRENGSRAGPVVSLADGHRLGVRLRRAARHRHSHALENRRVSLLQLLMKSPARRFTLIMLGLCALFVGVPVLLNYAVDPY